MRITPILAALRLNDESSRELLLLGGVFSSLLYVAMLVFVPLGWPGYDSAAQSVSELSAIDAPTRPLWRALALFWAFVYGFFGLGVWMAAGKSRALKIAGWMIIASAVFGLFWPPMHQREVLAEGGGTLSDTLHIVWTIVNAILTLAAIGFGAAAFGIAFRVYSIVTTGVMLGAGVLTAAASSRMEANLPTPWLGFWERVSMGAWLLWIGVFALVLVGRVSQTRDRGGSALPPIRRGVGAGLEA